VVVVDDCSTDGSQAVIGALPRIANLRIECSTSRRGMVGNFNRVVELSRGSWITVLGADDELLPTYYENLRPFVGHEDAAALSQTARVQWGTHETAFGPTEPVEFDLGDFIEMLGGAACISTTAFRRDLFDAVGGFDPIVGSFFDFDFFVRIAQVSGLPVKALGVDGGLYFPRRGSTWTRHEQSAEATELIYRWLELRSEEIGDEYAARARVSLARRACSSGKSLIAAGEPAAARQVFSLAASCSSGREQLKNTVCANVARLPAPVAATAFRLYQNTKQLARRSLHTRST
jgi:glycosyltransferase involved in cell wall biosynthesis